MYKLLFGVELSDYHSCMKRAASLSSAINDSNAINWCQFFWELASNLIGASFFGNWHQIYGAKLWSVCQGP